MKRACVVTGSRAEYGLLRWVMQRLDESSVCQLQIVVTGMHLSPEFGSTSEVIESDGFSIDWKVEMLLGSDSTVGVTKSMGLATIGFADAFAHLQPDLVLLLGDRYEILAAASAALIAGVPIAHLHGGEITEGAYDDAIRHSITKMARLHFTAAESYRARVIQMGEGPSTVWNVGGFGIDGIKETNFMTRSELESSLGISLKGPSLLVTFHPETASQASPKLQMKELISALEDVSAQIIFTMPNADNDGRIIFDLIKDFVARHPDRACAHVSLGQRRYLSALAEVDAVIGNSSSGLLEVPTFEKGTVNIGSRQDGRLRAPSVLDCPAERVAIREAINTVLTPSFRTAIKGQQKPYGNGGASALTVAIIEDWFANGGSGHAFKRFYDFDSGAE